MKIAHIKDNGKTKTCRVLMLDELVQLLCEKKSKDLIDDMRYELKYARKGEQAFCVQKIPQIIPAATYRKVKGVIQQTGYNGVVQLEVNDLAGEHEARMVKQTVADLPQTLLAFTGSSGRSVKIWVRFQRPDGSLPDTRRDMELFHAHAYRQAYRIYQPMLSFPIEMKEPVIDRACRFTFDAEPFYSPQAQPLVLQQPLEMPAELSYKEAVTSEPEPMKRMLPGYNSYHTLSLLFDNALSDALKGQNSGEGEEEFKALLVRLGTNCYNSGIPEDDAVRWTYYHYREEEKELLIRTTLHNTYEIARTPFGSKPCINPEMALAIATEEFMKRRYELRYNNQMGEVEYRERNTFCFSFKPITERVLNSIAFNAMKEGLKVWDRDVKRYVYSDAVPVFKPIEEYLCDLPRWDGRDRIRELADAVPCNNPFWRDLFYRWFLSMVAHWRGYDNRHANSTSPLLVGPQGSKKSTFCLSIMPPELRQYYTDSIDFGRKRDAELFLNRFALINIDEFDQITTNQQAFLKHILQAPVVKTRRPHGRSVQELRRYASFIGTSNHKDLLTDTSGSRRFICIEVTDVIDLSRPIHYEQLYSQALAAIYGGERYWFDREEEQLLTTHNQDFQEVSPLEELFHQYFRPAKKNEEGEWLLAVGILEHIRRKSALRLSTGKIVHFGRLLTRIGVISRRCSEGKVYFVVKKE